jgi:hypothetical protein
MSRQLTIHYTAPPVGVDARKIAAETAVPQLRRATTGQDTP